MLVARLVSLDGRAPFTAAGAHDAVLAMRDAGTRVPVSRFPRSILFDPERKAARYALTRAGEAAKVGGAEVGVVLADSAELRRHLRFLRPRRL